MYMYYFLGSCDVTLLMRKTVKCTCTCSSSDDDCNIELVPHLIKLIYKYRYMYMYYFLSSCDVTLLMRKTV